MGTACGYKWEGDICVRGVFIGLSMLLLVLLLGCFSVSYAFEYDFTQADMEKVAQWLYSNNSSFKNKAVTLYNTLSAHECDTYILWTYRYNGTYVIYLATLNKSQITNVNNSHNTNTMNITFTGDCYWGSAASNENNHYYTQTNGSNWGKGSGGQYRSPYLFFSNDLTNDVANNPNLEGPYENVEVIGPFEEPVQEFEFVTNSAINSCTITNQDGQTVNNVPIFYQPVESVSNVYLGELYMAEGSNKLIRLDYIQYAYYDSQSQSWVWRNLYNRQKSLPYRLVSNIYINVTNNAEYSIFQISQKGNFILRDAFYQIGFDDSELTRAYGYYAILSSTTSLDTDGRVDPTTLPPDYDDKAKRFNDNLDDIDNTTGAIDDTITPVPDIDSMLNHFTSGDFAGNLGFQEQDHGYWNFLYGFTTQICDTLLSSGDVYYDYQMHGETPTRIWSSQFYVPDDNPLKFFVSLSLIFGTVFVFYYQFKNFIEYLETANVPKVLEQEDADMYFYKM